MPNTKKELTKSGAMLPPWVMRDLAKLAETLYASPKLVQGDPVVPREEVDDEDAHLAFYKG